jgi:SAM-dependent methyltransferase
MTQDRYHAYDSFAWFYHKFWDGWSNQIAAPLDKLMLSYVVPGGLILDICCGTGTMAAHLGQLGYRVIGVDGSDEMLSYARAKAQFANFVCADARDFQVPELCDGALSVYDSLNHIMTLDDLRDVFLSVRRAIKPGAPFFFDVNNEASFSANWHGSFGKQDDECAVIAAGTYDPESKHAELAITMFRQQGGEWRRSDLVLEEHCFSDDEIREALAASGFHEITFYNTCTDFGFRAPGRLLVCCRAA